MRSFEELVADAERAEVTGWGFGFLDGRATEVRPPWGYARLLAGGLARVDSALDIDTGGGEVVAEAPVLPPGMTVTESWPPNAEHARQLLGPRGVAVVDTTPGGPLPFADGSFELVTSRHPVSPDWPEIARVLAPGGRYLAQHVGPGSAFELIERLLGFRPDASARDPDAEAADARRAGLRIVDLRRVRCRMEFYDIGAVVWILRKCPWWVPDFSVDGYRDQLQDMDIQMRGGNPVVAHSTRHLIEAGL